MKVNEILSEIASEEDLLALKKRSEESGKKLGAARSKLDQAKERMGGDRSRRRRGVRRRGTDAPSRVSAFGM